MAFVNTVDLIGDSTLTAKIVDRSVTEIADNVSRSIGSYAFYTGTNLTAVDFHRVTSIDNYAFYGCSNITTAKFQSAESIGTNGFHSCTSLTTIDFPALTSIGSNVFFGCSKLTSAKFPMLSSIPNRGFSGMTALNTIDLPAVQNIADYGFQQCSALTTLILRRNTVCALASSTAFPTSLSNFYIYVPRALLSDTDSKKDYRRATNWTNFPNQFRALEDYTVDGTTTGELDPTKI